MISLTPWSIRYHSLYRYKIHTILSQFSNPKLYAHKQQIVNISSSKLIRNETDIIAHQKLKKGNKLIKTLKIKASNGCAISENKLGDHYRFGIGVKRSPKLAIQSYKNAAMKENAQAQYNLSLCYANGIGLDYKDEYKAEMFLKCASKNGHPRAQFQMAVYYSIGTERILKNDKKALRLWQSSAEKGDSHSQWNLVQIFEKGMYGVSSNHKGAHVWLTKMCTQHDNARAFTRLGMYYKKGIGCEKNIINAAKWFYQAVKLKHPPAMYALAQLYQIGDVSSGFPQNLEKCIELLQRAEKANFIPAMKVLKKITKGIRTIH